MRCSTAASTSARVNLDKRSMNPASALAKNSLNTGGTHRAIGQSDVSGVRGTAINGGVSTARYNSSSVISDGCRISAALLTQFAFSRFDLPRNTLGRLATVARGLAAEGVKVSMSSRDEGKITDAAKRIAAETSIENLAMAVNVSNSTLARHSFDV